MKFLFTLFILTTLSCRLYSQSAWTPQNSPVTTELDGISSINGMVCWMCGPLNTVIRTTDGGNLWFIVNTGISGNFYDMYATDINHAWVGADDGKIWFTTNGGDSWLYSIPNPSSPFIDAIHMFDNNTGVAIGDPPANAVQWRYYFTTNGGINWALCPGAPPYDSATGWSNSLFALDTGHIWWGTNRSKIYKGSIRGPCYAINVNAQNQYGIAFHEINTGVALGIVGNPPDTQTFNLRTTTGGNNWYSTAFMPASVPYGIATKPGISSSFYWIAATDNIYRSTDNGITFSSQLALTFATYCISMVNVDTGWAAGEYGKIYKYISNDPIGVKKINTSVPKEYFLSQNYPNPFNPTTKIEFSIRPPLTPLLSKEGQGVVLKVYDMLGHEVATLVNENLKPGSYDVEFNASNFPSGVYFYSLVVGGMLIDSKKMIVLK